MAALGKGGKAISLGFSTLLGFHRLPEAVTLAIHLEDSAVVGQAVQESSGHAFALEDLTPFAEREVTGDEDAPALVAVAEDTKEQLTPPRLMVT